MKSLSWVEVTFCFSHRDYSLLHLQWLQYEISRYHSRMWIELLKIVGFILRCGILEVSDTGMLGERARMLVCK